MTKTKVVRSINLLLIFAVVGIFLYVGKNKPVKMTDVACLARNLAYETLLDSHLRPESRRELEAIMHVVFQRKQLGRKAGFSNTVCGVVYQRAAFSWTLKHKLRYKDPDNKQRWAYMRSVARDGLAGTFVYSWPRSHECIISYKRADNKGVGKKPAIWFRARMRPVIVIGSHEFFCPKKR
ncbi:MAG: hypothetical protein UY74_C0012G0022 [Candidatus Kaiserbacteria bacterium GW2011_GWC2_52_8b]|uniref:Cell wall hydrolase SleB domain-containing protein n=2 Tax=Candidatus Kaiseribacteriota TaxID=1752734 RepID=A0A0G2AG74_9BACT|nr:MAG: hypothetical protein UY67_C0029G0022 [Candidatus Kaiserbacteria bacterium GW2011_GWA2_52_12]KKW31534.1 MAG: hypothetical protein UY74_C0012G0022 [Candidatus Kaiserbacteria bacterium GW2011_GWC2_52_8b]